MTRRPLAALVPLVVLVGSVGAVADPPGSADLTVLVEQLGSPDFAERETATRRLAEIGPPALEHLRAALASDDAEVRRRASDVLTRIDRQLDNERTLAPTLVELPAAATSLEAVLADLSKQTGYAVAFDGSKAAAAAKVTLPAGKVPFWDAVRKVCDAADLHIASAGGFVAPGPLTDYPGQPSAGGSNTPVVAPPRPQATSTSVILEPRAGAPKRPAAVFGAVLVEAFPLPRAAGTPEAATALLQMWPEPKLTWQATRGVKVRRATDDAGERRIIDTAPAVAPRIYVGSPVRGGGRNVNWGGGFGNDREEPTAPAVGAGHAPNIRQAVVTFKPGLPGRKPAAALAAFEGSVFAEVRSKTELLAATEVANGQVDTTGESEVEIRAAMRKDITGQNRLEVNLTYDTRFIQPAGASDELIPDRVLIGGGPLRGNGPLRAITQNTSVYGVRVLDADGKPLGLSLAGYVNRTGGRWTAPGMRLTFDVVPDRDGKEGVPRTVEFWGTYDKPVEVPFALAGVPLTGGKK